MVWIIMVREFGIAGLLAWHLFYRGGNGKLGSLVVVRAEVRNFAVVVIWIFYQNRVLLSRHSSEEAVAGHSGRIIASRD